MSNRPLSTQDLADRWGVSSDLLASWRQHGIGPHFIQIGQHIRYPVAEVQSFEHQMQSKPCTVNGTKPATICTQPYRAVFIAQLSYARHQKEWRFWRARNLLIFMASDL